MSTFDLAPRGARTTPATSGSRAMERVLIAPHVRDKDAQRWAGGAAPTTTIRALNAIFACVPEGGADA